jgi:Peptidase family C25
MHRHSFETESDHRFVRFARAVIPTVALTVSLVAPATVRAQIPPELISPKPWPCDPTTTDCTGVAVTWEPITTDGGSVVRDPEGGKTTDSSNGGASFTAESDLASNWNDKAPTYNDCNPLDPASQQCGANITNNATMWWAWDDNSTTWAPTPNDAANGTGNGASSMTDDTLFLRMRINGDPRAAGHANSFSNGHWNFLHDIDGDGYKEFWFDVFGNNGIVRLLYENNDAQQIDNETPRPGATCTSPPATWLDTLVACVTNSGTSNAGYDCSYSFTRALPITGSQGAPNASSTEWYVDVQIPIGLLKIANDGCEFPTWLYNYTASTTAGDGCSTDLNCYLLEPTSKRRFIYSTSDSSTDPLQKDFTPGCNTVGGVITTCNYTYPTPVTLASFRTTSVGDQVRIDWTTGSELGNAGFDVYGKVNGTWTKLNTRLIPSQGVDSLMPLSYSLTVNAQGAQTFGVADVDIQGRQRWHGDFALGRTYGSDTTAAPTDWGSINSEHASKAITRGNERTSNAQAKANQARSGAAPWPVFDLRVDHDGLYRVTYEELAAAGLDLNGVQTAKIGLTNRGVPVAIRVEGGSSKGGSFGPGGFVEFYGQGVSTLYTHTNVYQLVVNASDAKRIREVKASATRGASAATTYTETVTVDNNNAWSFESPNGDPWYDQRVLAYTSPVSVDLPITVDALEPGPTTVSLGLWGVTSWIGGGPDHHVRVAVNGTSVGDARFDGLVSEPLSFNVPAGVLTEGANTITLTVVGDTGFPWDIVALDTYGVSYVRALAAKNGGLEFGSSAEAAQVTGLPTSDVVAYRMSAGGDIVRLVGFDVSRSGSTWTATLAGARSAATYLVSSSSVVQTPAIAPPPVVDALTDDPAEYLVITNPDFTSGLGPLVAAREAQGLTVKVVETDTLYDTLGHGIFDPEAIRDYVKYAVAHLGTRYVLLVGGDTYDYMNYLGVGSISFVPTFYMRTEELSAFTPVDGPFGDVDGDHIPDVAVGRLPVRSSAELATVIAKTLAYPAGAALGKTVFAADRSDEFAPFSDVSNQVIGTLPPGWGAQRAYIDDLGVAGAKSALVSGIDNGAALTHFLGHSDLDLWSWEGLFDNSDVPSLTNASQPTVVLQWGCWNTFFVEPAKRSIAEEFMVGGAGGAAAVIGASGRTTFDGDKEMDLILTPRLLQPGMTIGDALTQAKQDVRAMNPTLADVFYGINLMGDPALTIVP